MASRLKSIEQQHAEARAMGPEWDDDYVTFRSLPYVCESVGWRVWYSRRPGTRTQEVYDDAYSWAAEWVLRSQMGKRIAFVLVWCVPEYWRVRARLDRRYVGEVELSAFEGPKGRFGKTDVGRGEAWEDRIGDSLSVFDDHGEMEFWEAFDVWSEHEYDDDLRRWLKGDRMAHIAADDGVTQSAISLRIKRGRKSFGEFLCTAT